MNAASRRPGEPVRVPANVLEGLQAVQRRLAGEAHLRMLDRMAVQVWAMEMGYSETARWIGEHPQLYAEWLIREFGPAS